MVGVYGDHYGDLYDNPGAGLSRLFVEIDWAKTGDFADYHDDVTPHVRAQPGVSVSYGRDQTTALAPTVSGQGSLVLNNVYVDPYNKALGRKYAPRNPGSPLYGILKPARPVRVIRQIEGTDYTLFVGHTDDSPIHPEPADQTVSLSLVDHLADFRGQNISTQLHQGLRTGDAIGLILDAVGWPAADRDLDAGATLIPFWWEDNTDAFTALEKVVRSEGPPAMLSVGVNGEIVFRDRHHRLIRAASITSQSTWRATGTLEPVMQAPFSADEAWGNIVNAGTVSVDVRAPQELQPVWTSEETFTLSAGEQQIITAAASDPFLGAVTPEAGVDYVLTSGTVAVRLITTSGISTGIELTAGAGATVITGLQLRAQPVSVTHTVRVSAENASSIAEYGRRSYPDELSWCGVGDATAVLTTAVAMRSEPLPILSVRFQLSGSDAKAALILARDLSDRVRVIEPETYTDGDFYVESIAHDTSGVHDHSVTFGLEAAPTMPAPIFRFDTAGAGFGDGLFGGGFDEPGNLFIFDGTAGHGFGEGVFAH